MIKMPMGKKDSLRMQFLFFQEGENPFCFRSGINYDRVPALLIIDDIAIGSDNAYHHAFYLQHYPFPLSIS